MANLVVERTAAWVATLFATSANQRIRRSMRIGSVADADAVGVAEGVSDRDASFEFRMRFVAVAQHTSLSLNAPRAWLRFCLTICTRQSRPIRKHNYKRDEHFLSRPCFRPSGTFQNLRTAESALPNLCWYSQGR